MGEPVKIVNLAKQMLKLRGLKIKDNHNLDGDIEIKYTGLRPGEKLFEELIIDGKQDSTAHPFINKANESTLIPEDFVALVDELEIALRKNLKKRKEFQKKLVKKKNK